MGREEVSVRVGGKWSGEGGEDERGLDTGRDEKTSSSWGKNEPSRPTRDERCDWNETQQRSVP